VDVSNFLCKNDLQDTKKDTHSSKHRSVNIKAGLLQHRIGIITTIHASNVANNSIAGAALVAFAAVRQMATLRQQQGKQQR